MSKQYDFSAFDKPAPKKEYNFSAFNKPTAEDDTPSGMESLARGAAQGATLGFADELAGAGSALVNTVAGDNDSLEDVWNDYKKNRDESRANFDKAQKAHPWLYGGGQIAGGLLPGIASAGIAPAAEGAALGTRLLNAGKVGAGLGAITGLGDSSADSIGGEIADTGAGLAKGAVLGPVIEGGLSALGATGRGIAKLGNKTKLGRDVGTAYNMGTEGTNLLDTDVVRGIENNETRAGTEKVANILFKGENSLSQKVSKQYQEAKEQFQNGTFDITQFKDELKKIYDGLSSNGSQLKDKLALMKIYEDATTTPAFKYTSEQIIDSMESPSAREKLSKITNVKNAEAQTLGDTGEETLSPLGERYTQVDVPGKGPKKTVILDKETGEPISSSLTPKQILDEESGQLVDNVEGRKKLLEKLNDLNNLHNMKSQSQGNAALSFGEDPYTVLPVNNSNNIGVFDKRAGRFLGKTIEDTPQQWNQTTVPAEITDLPPAQKDFLSPQEGLDFKNEYSNLSKFGEGMNSQQGTNAGGQSAGVVGKAFDEQFPGYANADAAYKTLNEDIYNNLGIKQDLGPNGDQLSAIKKLRKLLFGYDQDSGIANTQRMNVSEAMPGIEKIDPQAAQQMQDILDTTSKKVRIARMANNEPFTTSGNPLETAKGLIGIKGANVVGQGVGAINKTLVEMPKERLASWGNQLVQGSNPVGQRLGRVLVNAADKDQIGRNALIFSLMQNSEYRDLLKSHTGIGQ